MSSNQPVYLTAEGLQKIKDELHYLVTTRRREVAQMIAEAKAEGDLSENAGYDEAKTAQGFLEGRVRELEYIINHAQLIEENSHTNVIGIGRTVIIREVDTDFEETYTIVGSRKLTRYMVASATKARWDTLWVKEGSKVNVKTPGGDVKFEILKIE